MTSASGAVEFANLCKNGADGFVAFHEEPGTLMVIPMNYIVLIAGMFAPDSFVSGMRWSVFQENNKEYLDQSAPNLDMMLTTYPSLKATDYGAWQTLLTDYFQKQLPAVPASESAAA